jgi:hypothetical protein
MSVEIAFKQLEELGYKPVKQPHNMVSFEFTVPHGRFRNQEVVIALQVPQFPDVPPSGPYIKPFLLPINTQSKVHPLGGIHQRNLPTNEFQYWSRPFPEWDKTDKTMRTYLAFLRTLFDFE